MKWINEWKGTSDIPYVSTIEYGATNLNLDYTSNKINYQIVLDKLSITITFGLIEEEIFLGINLIEFAVVILQLFSPINCFP